MPEGGGFNIWQEYWDNSPLVAGLTGGTWTVLGVRYLGIDANNLPKYEISFKTVYGSQFTRHYSLEGNHFVKAHRDMQFELPKEQAEFRDRVFAMKEAERQRELAELALPRAKEDALLWLTEMTDRGVFDPIMSATLQAQIKHKRSVEEIQRLMTIYGAEGLLPLPEFEEITGDPLGGFPTSLPDGDGGSGSLAPIYVQPDRRVIEDLVKGTMVSLVGTVLDGRLGEVVDLYMSEHKKNFDTLESTIDPSQSVLERIRNTAEYKFVHKNRPASADERTWVSDRLTAAAQGGLTQPLQEDFAIMQAAAAGDVPDVRRGAGVTQTRLSGSSRGTVLENTVNRAASNLFRGVIR
jgi:hypothetical protein